MGIVDDGKRRTRLEGEEVAAQKNTTQTSKPAGDSNCAIGDKERNISNPSFRIGVGIVKVNVLVKKCQAFLVLVAP